MKASSGVKAGLLTVKSTPCAAGKVTVYTSEMFDCTRQVVESAFCTVLYRV